MAMISNSMLRGGILGAGMLLVSAGGASAQEREAQWYGAVGGSVTLRSDASGEVLNAAGPGVSALTENFYEPGLGALVALGRRLGPFRVEGELGYTRDPQDRYEAIFPPTGQIFADTTEKTLRAMGNVYFDFGRGDVQPYVGAGIGYASSDLTVITARAPFPTEQPRILIDDRAGGFAYQVMAGVAVPLNQRVSLTAQYRWFDAGTFEGFVDTRGEPVYREHSGSNVDIGLRVNF